MSNSQESTCKSDNATMPDEVNTSAVACTNSTEVATEQPSTTDEYIQLRVITSDMNNEVHFRVKFTTALGRLKRSYCNRLGLQVEELRFVFDGHRITDTETPKDLKMENHDIIEIYQERTGG